MRLRAYQLIQQRIDAFEHSEMERRTQLIAAARGGDQAAREILRTRYGLRLPLIEAAHCPAAPQPSEAGR